LSAAELKKCRLKSPAPTDRRPLKTHRGLIPGAFFYVRPVKQGSQKLQSVAIYPQQLHPANH
jgi:hypothetical protein